MPLQRKSLILLKKKFKELSNSDAAPYLVRFFLPRYKLYSSTLKRSTYQLGNDKKGFIHWYYGHDLYSLLHEIGHAKYNHFRSSGPLGDPENTPLGAVLFQEAQAWLFAERWSKILSIRFDYADAEQSFKAYFRKRRKGPGKGRRFRPTMQINWRYKHGKEEVQKSILV